MIPQTLLWVGLVVAWLVVLVPMLVARHPKVNTVTDATLKTRLLHRGGAARTAVRRKIRPPRTAPDRDETVDPAFAPAAAAADVDLDADEEIEPLDGADVEADDLDDAHAYVDSDVDGVARVDSDVDGVASPLDANTTPIVTVHRADLAKASDKAANAPRIKDLDLGAADEDSEHLFEFDGENSAPEQGNAGHDADTGTDDNHDDYGDDNRDDYGDDNRDAEIAGDESLTEEVSTVNRDQVERDEIANAELDAELDDEQREQTYPTEEVAVRPRRGGFDPENDARVSQARYRFRQRVTLVLGVLAVVALGAGWLNVRYGWYALGAVLAALVIYLAYLRRTVRIETEIRRRRLARLERSRRDREREAEVVDGVPAHRRKSGGIVLEIDDEDPAFDHLPRYRSAEFDFLRPPFAPREIPARKVG